MTLILSGTDGLSDVDGSAATPAIRGTDTNTGIFFPAADTIAFSEGGVESMRLDSSGNLGIGTSSIQGKFNVASGRSFFGANSETYSIAAGFTQARVASGQVFYIGATDSATPDLVFSNSAGTERARITSTGDFQFNSGYGSVATAYGCRAWVNFNGTGTVAIRASGNVSSITDNGTGDYTVNFTTAMPDANYSPHVTYNQISGATNCGFTGFYNATTTGFRCVTLNSAGSFVDGFAVSTAVFR